jgi:hypothetical protein
MHLTIATQNLREGGWGSLDPARPDPDYDRLDDIADRLRPAGADILIVNEIRDQRDYNTGKADPAAHLGGHAPDLERMRQLGDALGLALAGVAPSRSGIPSAVLYRPGDLGLLGWFDRFSTWFTNGCGTAVFAIPGYREPLAVATVHADPWAWIDTARELQRTVALVSEFNVWGVLGGDFNCPPAYGPPAEVAGMRPHHRMNRLADPTGSDPAPNLEPVRALEDAGYVDAAAVLDACAPRSGESDADWLDRTRTGKTDRIDRLHLTPALARTPIAYQRLGASPYASDHFGAAATIDLELA